MVARSLLASLAPSHGPVRRARPRRTTWVVPELAGGAAGPEVLRTTADSWAAAAARLSSSWRGRRVPQGRRPARSIPDGVRRRAVAAAGAPAARRSVPSAGLLAHMRSQSTGDLGRRPEPDRGIETPRSCLAGRSRDGGSRRSVWVSAGRRRAFPARVAGRHPGSGLAGSSALRLVLPEAAASPATWRSSCWRRRPPSSSPCGRSRAARPVAAGGRLTRLAGAIRPRDRPAPWSTSCARRFRNQSSRSSTGRPARPVLSMPRAPHGSAGRRTRLVRCTTLTRRGQPVAAVVALAPRSTASASSERWGRRCGSRLENEQLRACRPRPSSPS